MYLRKDEENCIKNNAKDPLWSNQQVIWIEIGVREVGEKCRQWDKGTWWGRKVSERMSGCLSREGHCCDRRELHEHPDGSCKDNGERRGDSVGGEGKDEMCWEWVEGRGVGGTWGGWRSAITLGIEGMGVDRFVGEEREEHSLGWYSESFGYPREFLERIRERDLRNKGFHMRRRRGDRYMTSRGKYEYRRNCGRRWGGMFWFPGATGEVRRRGKHLGCGRD